MERPRHLAFLILVFLCLPSGWAEEGTAVSPSSVVLKGEAFDTRLHLDTGRLELLDENGAVVLTIPSGLALRPVYPPSLIAHRMREEIQVIAGEVEDGEEEVPAAATIMLASADEERLATVGIRPAPHGVFLIYSIPHRTFEGLKFNATAMQSDDAWIRFSRNGQGRRLSVGGVRHGRGVSVVAPARIALDLTEILGDDDARSFRLRGTYGIDDISSAGATATLRVLVDGIEVYRGTKIARGSPTRTFNVPLRAGRELVFEVMAAPDGEEPVTVDMFDVEFAGSADSIVRVLDVLRSNEPGLDLLVDEAGSLVAGEDLIPLPPEPGPGREGVSAVAVGEPWGSSNHPLPLLLPFRTGGGKYVGVGLGYLPSSTRFSFEAGRVSLNCPTLAFGESDPLEMGLKTIIVAVVVADNPKELWSNYRQALILCGGSVIERGAGTLVVPKWWRKPLLFVSPSPVEGRFGHFTDLQVEKRIQEAIQKLGIEKFTVVINGDWSRVPGDPVPSDDFQRLKSLIASQHVRGRRVLLRWNMFQVDEGSLADRLGIAGDGLLELFDSRKTESYADEVVRRCLLRQLHGLGADGLFFTGEEHILDANISGGKIERRGSIGLRNLSAVLGAFRKAVDRRELDSLLVANSAIPQLVVDMGGVSFDPRSLDRDIVDQRLERLAAVLPDLPVFFLPRSGTVDDVLSFAARGVAIGIPGVDARMLDGMNGEAALALGAILSLAEARPLGIPELLEDGRWRMSVEGRLLAETLAGDSGVVVYPDHQSAWLAVIRKGNVPLPFRPSGSEDGVAVELGEDGDVLVGAVTGRVYRFSLR